MMNSMRFKTIEEVFTNTRILSERAEQPGVRPKRPNHEELEVEDNRLEAGGCFSRVFWENGGRK